eukprot:jgi/Tetstr1/449557/TSEL_036644.t1
MWRLEAIILLASVCRMASRTGAVWVGEETHLKKQQRMLLVSAPGSLPVCTYSKVQSGGRWVDEDGDAAERDDSDAQTRSLREIQGRTHGGEAEQTEREKKHSPSSYRWKHVGCHPQSYGIPDAETLRKSLGGRKILFLGDSTMGYLHRGFIDLDGVECSRSYREQADRCSLARYLRLPDPHAYPHGRKVMGEGPFKIGLDRPGCTDCSGCQSKAARCVAHSEVEFITMEHNADRTVSSSRFETTQDAIIDHYLATSSRKPDVIVVNTGLHPMSMCSFARFKEFFPRQKKRCWQRRASMFASQARTLLKRLQGVAPTVIWVSISAVQDSLQAPERLAFGGNNNTIEFNRAMAPVLDELQVPVLDTYRMSSVKYAMDELHSDPVHLRNHGDLYYKELAAMLAQAIVQTLQNRERRQQAEQKSAASLLKMLPVGMLGGGVMGT